MSNMNDMVINRFCPLSQIDELMDKSAYLPGPNGQPQYMVSPDEAETLKGYLEEAADLLDDGMETLGFLVEIMDREAASSNPRELSGLSTIITTLSSLSRVLRQRSSNLHQHANQKKVA